MRLILHVPGRAPTDLDIPADYTPEDLIRDATRELGLPLADSSGAPIHYSLLHVNGNRTLPAGRRLSESGVSDGDTLRLESFVEVVLSILDLNKTERVTLPREATVAEIIRSVALDYGLPSRDLLGALINYKLESKVLARFLSNGETLARAGIPHLDRLSLHREEIAGGGWELPFSLERRSSSAGTGRLLSLARRAAARLRRLAGAARYDPVDCTVYAPPIIPKGGATLVQVYVYHPTKVFAVRATAREFDKYATRRGFKSLEMKLARGTALTLHLSVPGVEVDEPVQTVVWNGHMNLAEFVVTVPRGLETGDVIGTLRISREQIPLGHIKFILAAVEPEEAVHGARPVGSGYAYKKAFVSYASEDRPEVMKRVQMLRLMRIKTFQDILDIAPGARWERKLYRHIDESDLFLLFWSAAAGRSEWVRREIRYALAVKGGDDLAPPEIMPVPIEGPPTAPPPEELAHLQFDDYYLYFMGRK